MSRLFTIEHRTVSYVSGPLLVADGTADVGYGELVEVVTPTGQRRRGQVLEVEGDYRTLVKLRERRPERFLAGAVVYTGEQTIPLSERIWAIPVGGLWSH